MIGIVVVMAISGLALHCNAPSAKVLRFEVACERFPVATSLYLDLNYEGTQLQAVSADGFLLQAKNAAVVQLRPSDRPAVNVPSGSLTLSHEQAAGPQLNSHLHLVRRRAIQNVELRLEPFAELVATTTQAPDLPWLTVVSKRAKDAELTVRGLEVEIVEGNRYRVHESDSHQAISAFSATLSGALPGRIVEAKLESSARARTYAALTFAKPASLSLPLLKDAVKIDGPSQLEFFRAINPNLRLGEKRIDGIPSDQRVNLVAAASNTTIDALRLINDAGRSGLPALFVSGQATVQSLRLDGRELLPTTLDEILNEPVPNRTLTLLALGAIAAVLLKVLDRALSVILEIILPAKEP